MPSYSTRSSRGKRVYAPRPAPRRVGAAYRARPLSAPAGRRAVRRQARGYVPANTLSRRR